MIVDATKLIDAVDAVNNRAPNVDLAGLERQVQLLSPEERERLRHELVTEGKAVLAFNGTPVTLQVSDRSLPRK